MLEKLIITIYPTKKPKDIELISLLDKSEKATTPLLRKRLSDIDLKNKLILINNRELSKLFKPDYTFNDHGIYYDLIYDFRISNSDYERLYKKEHKLYVSKPLPEEHVESCANWVTEQLLQNRLNSVVVFMERETSKRDYERFLQYDSFVDTVSDYSVLRNYSDMNYYFQKYSEVRAFILDIETTGLDFTKDSLLMLSVKAVEASEVLIIHNPDVYDIKLILKALEGKKVIGHNLLFDLSWLMYYCSMEFSPDFDTIDTMLLAHVSGERRLSLKHLSMMYGNFKGRRNTLDADEAYLIEDMLTTELLWNQFKHIYNSFAGRLVCEAVKSFAETKVSGVVLDKNRLFEIRDEYKHLEEPKYDFNVNSNSDLAEYFIGKGVVLTEKTEKGSLRVDQISLNKIRDKYPVVAEYLDYKAELNIYQKYILPYCALTDVTIRPNIKLFGTETGRLSCSDPNVQQIPNKSLFKDIFRSRFEDGLIATIDLDRAELGIAALLSGDSDYVKALLSDDFHRLIAAMTFQKKEEEVTKLERFTAKAVNFGGVLYGGSARGIAARIDVETEVVEKIQNWYKQGFPILTEWIEKTKHNSAKTRAVHTYFGRTRILNNMDYAQAMRIGVNTSVQSVASDVMLYIVVRLSSLLRKNKLQSKILFPVHDELLLDIKHSELETVEELLQQAFSDVLKTPLGKLELSKILPISGTLEYAKSWLYLKSDKYQPEGKLFISSLKGKQNE